MQASLLLRKQLSELNKHPVEGFSAGLIDDDDIFRWEVSQKLLGPSQGGKNLLKKKAKKQPTVFLGGL